MQSGARTYGVSEAARELGLSADWLRQGEKRGVLPPAKRDINGRRYYTIRDIARLRELGVGKRKAALPGQECDD